MTDPPYGVDYSYESWDAADAVVNDALYAWLLSVEAEPLVYFCGSVNLARELTRSPAKVLIWHKPWSMTHSGIGNGRHHWEPIIVRRLPSPAYLATDVLVRNTDRVPGLRDEHSCPKPVALFADLITGLTESDGWVIDPFLGSGTAVIACESERRQCYGVEVDPAYVDVSCRRWELFTGAEATLEATGQTFAEVAKERE